MQLIPRDEYLRSYWQYQAGESVTVLAPTGEGKTTLMMQLLAATPGLRIVIDTKKKSPEMDKACAQYGFRATPQWPVSWWNWMWFRECDRWVVRWPHLRDIEANEDRLARLAKEALNYIHEKGNAVLYWDECLDAVDLGLGKALRVIWTRGRSSRLGLWTGSQRPFNLPVYAYDQAKHLFLGNDPDVRNRQRFRDIGGFDPEKIDYYVQRLPRFHYLVINRNDRTMCVIGA
jgi:hypothetical protein